MGLRRWFVIHFVADWLFAVPLMLAPVFTLTVFGFQTIDPFAARLVAAALMGIGGESLLGRNASAETFRAMLNLKIIWSGAALAGMLVTLLQSAAPPFGWAIVAIFAVFNGVWVWYRLQLG